MIRTFLLSAALLACVPHADAQARRDTLTGDQVLERSRSAYAGLTSYAGETAVLSEIGIGDTVMTHATSAQMRFVRPGRFRLSGRAVDGTAYLVVSDGARTRTALVPTDPKSRQGMRGMSGLLGIGPAGGDTLASDTISTELGLAMVTGIGNRAPYYLSALLGLMEGSPVVHRTPAVLAGRETIAGVESYKVVIRGPGNTVTYWVDTASFLLRQLQDEQTGPQLAATFGQAGEMAAEQDTSTNELVAATSALVTGALRVMPRPRGMSFLVRFSNLRVNAPLDPALFALPPRRADSRPPE
jgi:hypothetical protein